MIAEHQRKHETGWRTYAFFEYAQAQQNLLTKIVFQRGLLVV